MSLRFGLVGVVFVALVLGACGGGSGDGASVRVVATTTQISAMASVVGGPSVRVTTLLGAGASAHDFEPSSDTMKRLETAKVVLKNGLGLDDWLDKTISSSGSKAKVAVVSEGAKTAKREGEVDPHIWHDADNAAVMVDNIVKALVAADAANGDTYRSNGEAYKQRLRDADREVASVLGSIPAENRRVVTNHDAFGYFFDRYGLTVVGAVIPSTSSEAQPSAKQIAELDAVIRQEKVRAIFAESEVDPKVAREVSRDTGVKIVTDLYADSLGPAGSGAESVEGMWLWNAKKIAEALR